MPLPPPKPNLELLDLIQQGYRYTDIGRMFGWNKKQVKDRAAILKRHGYTFIPRHCEMPEDGYKRCRACDQLKGVGQFYSRPAGIRSGTSSWCRSCVRLGTAGRKYGLSKAEVEALLKQSGESCPLCLKPYTEERIACIDHCHKSGAVRGVICLFCNHAIGRMFDDPSTAERVARYLRGSANANK